MAHNLLGVHTISHKALYGTQKTRKLKSALLHGSLETVRDLARNPVGVTVRDRSVYWDGVRWTMDGHTLSLREIVKSLRS